MYDTFTDSSGIVWLRDWNGGYHYVSGDGEVSLVRDPNGGYSIATSSSDTTYTLTTAKITSALGYVPANGDDYFPLSIDTTPGSDGKIPTLPSIVRSTSSLDNNGGIYTISDSTTSGATLQIGLLTDYLNNNYYNITSLTSSPVGIVLSNNSGGRVAIDTFYFPDAEGGIQSQFLTVDGKKGSGNVGGYYFTNEDSPADCFWKIQAYTNASGDFAPNLNIFGGASGLQSWQTSPIISLEAETNQATFANEPVVLTYTSYTFATLPSSPVAWERVIISDRMTATGKTLGVLSHYDTATSSWLSVNGEILYATATDIPSEALTSAEVVTALGYTPVSPTENIPVQYDITTSGGTKVVVPAIIPSSEYPKEAAFGRWSMALIGSEDNFGGVYVGASSGFFTTDLLVLCSIDNKETGIYLNNNSDNRAYFVVMPQGNQYADGLVGNICYNTAISPNVGTGAGIRFHSYFDMDQTWQIIVNDSSNNKFEIIGCSDNKTWNTPAISIDPTTNQATIAVEPDVLSYTAYTFATLPTSPVSWQRVVITDKAIGSGATGIVAMYNPTTKTWTGLSGETIS